MFHHTFDRDPEDLLEFVWSEGYANDDAFPSHVSNPPVQDCLQHNAELRNKFSLEQYAAVGSDCGSLMESLGLSLKIFETTLGSSRAPATLVF